MKLGRRTVLQIAGATVAAAALHRSSLAHSGRVLTLIDAGLLGQDLQTARAALGANAKPIDADVVRQWRDGLDSEIAHAGGALGYVRWDKALLLTGLARESGMTARHVRLDRSLFAVRITS